MHIGGQQRVTVAIIMSSDSLCGDDKKRYIRKVYGVLGSAEAQHSLNYLDPYKLPAESWVDDITRWPRIEFGQVYVYLVDTPGGYTREALKAFKSLEAYNYYLRYAALFYKYNYYMVSLLLVAISFLLVAGSKQFFTMTLGQIAKTVC